MDCVTRKHMLYKTKVDYRLDAHGEPVNDYAMNHAVGCSHGCKYPCYALISATRFGQVGGYDEWCRPKPVANTIDLLRRELAVKRKEPIKRVHMCFTTDPLPYIGDRADCEALEYIRLATMESIAAINDAGIPVTLLTKGELPEPHVKPVSCLAIERPRASIPMADLHSDNYYGISLVSLDEDFRKEYEPNAAPFANRLASSKALHDSGCKTWVSIEPWMEPVNYHFKAIDELYSCLNAIIFVDRIVFGKRNYSAFKSNPLAEIYYNKCAKIVREFCSATGIECIIKSGTETGGRS